MTFAEPQYWILLLPWALLLAWRFRNRDRRRRVVATLALWQLAAAGVRAHRRPRRPALELFVEAALGLVLIALLAAPEWRSTSSAELLVVIDSGSAMQAPERRAEIERRLADLEREHGEAQLRYLPERDDAGLVDTDGELWAARLGGLLRDDREVHLLADRILDRERLPPEIGVGVIAADIANVGITAVHLRRESRATLLDLRLDRSAAAETEGLLLRVSPVGGGAALAEQTLGRIESGQLVTLAIERSLPEEVLVELVGEAGPDFDDQVILRVAALGRAFVIAEFPGSDAWRAALRAAGRDDLRVSSAAASESEGFEVLTTPAGRGDAILLAVAELPAGLARSVDPALVDATLVAEPGGPLADLEGLAGLVASSGAHFEVTDPAIEVLARRARKAVLVRDARTNTIHLADPESRAAWRRELGFPLLVDALARLLAARSGSSEALTSRLSSPGETRGDAESAEVERPAAPARSRSLSRPFRPETAFLGLLLLGILLFLRRKEWRRRESSPAC